MIGRSLMREELEYAFLDPDEQRRWDKLRRAFSEEVLELVSWTDDRTLMIVKVTGPRVGVAYAAVDLKSGQANKVGDVYAGLGPEDVAAVKEISYLAGDGRKIAAYLTLPKGREAKGLPLVVLPHGGPAARDMPGFDWWAQALASRGYAVLQPQFRGSDGLGWDLLSAGFGEWGRRMQTDLSDGVQFLAKDGTVDPKRVCIVGGSYGGYAALAGVTLQQGVYRCAVAVGGLSDLRKFNAWRVGMAGDNEGPSFRYWNRMLGVKTPGDPALDAISPAHMASKATAPTLLIHGKDDTVVPVEQSRIMAEALRKAGRPAELVVLDGEDHWLSRSQTRLQMLQATVKFLEANNPPG